MDKQKQMDSKLKVLKFTNSKTVNIVQKGVVTGIERQREALNTIVRSIENLKLEIIESKFKQEDDEAEIETWSKEIEHHVDEADAEITRLEQRLASLKAEEELKVNKAEDVQKAKVREEQLQFERAQYEQKLLFEQKIEETKKKTTTTAAKPDATTTTSTRLPKLVITKFNGEPTDWLRFWNVFEVEIDNRSDLPAVTKFAYLKEMLKQEVRSGVEGLPLSIEGYTRAKNILRSKYGKTTEIVNAYVQNIMALPEISGSKPARIHDFYEKLLFNVQALETMGKLKEVNGYVRMSVDKLEGIRGDLVRTDDDWQEWDFPKFVDALRKWTERNPIRVKPKENQSPQLPGKKRDHSYRTQQGQGEQRGRVCVYCDSEEHKSFECNSVVDQPARRSILQQKRLCFNCTRSGHRAKECK